MTTQKRRKSNWYIYAAAFAITMAFAVMAVSTLWDKIMPEKSGYVVNSSGKASYLPDASNNMMVLVMISYQRATAPDYFVLINYRPAEEIIECIPFRADTKASVGGRTGTLASLYDSGGVASMQYAFEGMLGIKCDFYIKFDSSTFMNFIDSTGKVAVNIPYDVQNDSGETVFKSGTHSLGGTELFSYMESQKPTAEEDYQSVVVGGIATYVLNTSFRNLSSTLMQTYFTTIINTTDTNITFEDYTARQKAFMYTSESSYNPAKYYIPYGEADESGSFVIAENSIATIKERLTAQS